VVHEGTAADLAQSEMVQKAFVGAAFTKQSVRKSRRERRLAESNPGGADA
jgi:hypothetical protein